MGFDEQLIHFYWIMSAANNIAFIVIEMELISIEIE